VAELYIAIAPREPATHRCQRPLNAGPLPARNKPVTIDWDTENPAHGWTSGPAFLKAMAILQGTRLKNQFWTAPNQITLLRLIFIPFVIISVFDGDWRWALGLLLAAALSDALDGLLARALHQQTLLGQFLDPLADKLLLSSLFMVLSFVKKIPWKYTVVVFSRDTCIVATAIVLYATVGFRDFRPSIFGKINTACQIAAVFFVVLSQVQPAHWVQLLVKFFLYATFTFTTISGVHYVLITGHRLRKTQLKSSV
jgi:cardiolipin synthase (CMP-forming)